MTVIVWDGTTLAADKQMGVEYPRAVTKIQRTHDGELIGICGHFDHGQELVRWYLAGCNPATFPARQADDDKSSELIIIRADGSLWMLLGSPTPIKIENPSHAIGSGRDFAVAAMYLGKDAREAVEIACELCGSCGLGVDTLTLGGA